MTPIQPLGQPEPVRLQFQFYVSEDWLDEQIQELGMQLPDDWEVEFLLTEVPTPYRGRLMKAHRAYTEVPGYPTLYAPTDNPEDFLEVVEDWLGEALQRNSEEEEAVAMLRKSEEEESLSFERERRAWIEQHGSDRLRIAESRGYKINRLYALERASSEFPFAWVATGNEAEWRERTDPTLGALQLEEQLKAYMEQQALGYGEPRIVWLVEPPKSLEEALDEVDVFFEQQEAIVVNEFLGRYSLFIPVDEELQRHALQNGEVGA